MKKLRYTLFTAILSVAMTAGFSSCSDSFLDEENKASYTTDYFKTSQGIQDLATALYGNIRWHFGYEWAYGITLYGTDEFTNGSDLTAEPWNTYDSRLNPLNCTKANGAANDNCPGRHNSVIVEIMDLNFIRMFLSEDKSSKKEEKSPPLQESFAGR